MTYRITAAKDDDYILIEVQGEIDRETGMQWTLEAHVLGKQLGIRNYLVDVTDAVNKDSALEQYRFANTGLTENDLFDRFARIAVLTAPKDHSHDFIETVCRNVGLNMRLFRTRQEAMTFLGCGHRQAINGN